MQVGKRMPSKLGKREATRELSALRFGGAMLGGGGNGGFVLSGATLSARCRFGRLDNVGERLVSTVGREFVSQ